MANGGIIGPVNTVTPATAQKTTQVTSSSSVTLEATTTTVDFLAVGAGGGGGSNYGGAGGPATNGITFGGTQTPNPGVRTAQAETYDGTCWTTSASMSVGRSNAHGKATLNGATSSLCATGNAAPAPFSNATEDFTGAGPVTQTLTTT